MPLIERIQNLIHQLDAGMGRIVLRPLLIFLAVVALATIYDLRAYKNFASAEAMDSAQLARNISEGKGYTTLYVRPFSMYLIQSHNQEKTPVMMSLTNVVDYAEVRKSAHPDIANPPVYPVALAGLMKILPFNWTIENTKPFWSESNHFIRYQPEFLIALFNQLLLVAAAIWTFAIAKKLLDSTAAWTSALLMIGSDVVWRFSVSGLSTMLLLNIFLALVWFLMKIEEASREAQPANLRILLYVLAAGFFVGLGALTRYGFGWMIVPVIVFLVLFTGRNRFIHAIAAVGIFLIVLSPWLVRNEIVCGTPFGTAGYAVADGATFAPGALDRSVQPNLAHAFNLRLCMHKLLGNLGGILQNELPGLGGSWAAMLFFAGLLLPFRNVGARRLRYFLLMSLLMLAIVQALGHSSIAVDPQISADNYVVLTIPLVLIFASAFFLTCVETMQLAIPELRLAVIAGLLVICWVPLLLGRLLPYSSPLTYPPYYPPDIKKIAGWMNPGELIMSDTPWAIAWYGNRQCVSLTLDAHDDFYAISDYIKEVRGLYLSPQIMDQKLLTDCLRGNENSWGNFALKTASLNQLPKGFPLRTAPNNIPSGLFLTDQQRWKSVR